VGVRQRHVCGWPCPTIVTGSGLMPAHRVAVQITCAGEDIDDYLTNVTDGDGCLHSDVLTWKWQICQHDENLASRAGYSGLPISPLQPAI
jgi:hypothetical protein